MSQGDGDQYGVETFPVAPRTLDDLPEHRREGLLWRYALRLDYDGVEDLVLARGSSPCQWRPYRTYQQLTAVLGTDGRYHLQEAGRVICTDLPNSRQGHVRHRENCCWRRNADGYRIQPRVDSPVGTSRSTRFPMEWAFTLTDTVQSPELVPPTQRCPTSEARCSWPAYQGINSPRAQIRLLLAEDLGCWCHACHLAPAAALDHDHLTVMVRGLLCRDCNTHIDTCPHLSGCPWAEYLNDPPAGPYGLRYPSRGRPKSTHQQRVDMLGIDPSTRGVGGG